MTNEQLKSYIECVENSCQSQVQTLENFTIKTMRSEISAMRKAISSLQYVCFALLMLIVALFFRSV